MLSKIINYIFNFIPLVVSTVVTFVSMFGASLDKLQEEIPQQVERIAALEQAYNCLLYTSPSPRD